MELMVRAGGGRGVLGELGVWGARGDGRTELTSQLAATCVTPHVRKKPADDSNGNLDLRFPPRRLDVQ